MKGQFLQRGLKIWLTVPQYKCLRNHLHTKIAYSSYLCLKDLAVPTTSTWQ